MKPIVSISACNSIVLHRISVIPISMGALDELLDLPNLLGTGHFTSQERKRVLGQSRDFIFEKHYQAEFIQRDLQHVVLLRPPQEGLLQRAAGMLRNRDPLAPSNITDKQLRAIHRHPEILELR